VRRVLGVEQDSGDEEAGEDKEEVDTDPAVAEAKMEQGVESMVAGVKQTQEMARASPADCNTAQAVEGENVARGIGGADRGGLLHGHLATVVMRIEIIGLINTFLSTKEIGLNRSC